MAHYNSASTVPSVPIPSVTITNVRSNIYAGSPPRGPKLNTSDDEPVSWKSFGDTHYGPKHPCYPYWLKYEEEAKDKHRKRLANSVPDPYIEPPQFKMPDKDLICKWNKCHLLSLPKELRLQIWAEVLTDASISELRVGIFREPSSPYLRHPRPAARKFNVSLHRNASVNINLLQVNRFVYEEALPILYESAQFAPWDLEGLLPRFLDSLSPFARTNVRRIKLRLPAQVTAPTLRLDPSRPFFHWAITCAQVAKLNGSLQEVEIEGDWTVFDKESNRRAILSPLCKIKAAKKFTPSPKDSATQCDYHEEFQKLLAEVELYLKGIAQTRKERTEADHLLNRAAAELRRKQEIETQKEEEEQRESRGAGSINDSSEMQGWQRFAEANIRNMQQDLEAIPGIKQFETELEAHNMPEASIEDVAHRVGTNYEGRIFNEYGARLLIQMRKKKKEEEETSDDWDLVSVRIGASTPRARPASVISKASSDDTAWTGMASTIWGKDDSSNKGDESDAESESWEEL
ncbi:hypothetical protein K504DRAFT_459712 [Pleomassaria siparia CBS 279.74]|uniref:DUF7730 domain-containing protein n=1 Tax=Pleomassaria siparia CBS 279.74 TaxID=1314801 RepID=A0A6G1K0P2_9PLEO|nr:hypothetical protein K504DRAFT_459712 [Pleomassaria siparia CBS 279.74]